MVTVRQFSSLINPLQSSTNLSNKFLKCPFYNFTAYFLVYRVDCSFNNSITHASDPAKRIAFYLVCCSIITLLQSGEGAKLEILITELYSKSCTSVPVIIYTCRCTSTHTLSELDPCNIFHTE
jgi:hypothetical protein